MKKIKFLAYAGAIALLSTGFTACSDKDEFVAETNPTYDPETGEVTVDFVFNVETGTQKTTRMSSSTAQIGTGTFRGMRDAQLFTYKLSADGSHVTTGTEPVNKTYDLNQLISSGGLNGTGTDVSRRVLEMSLPTGTNTLMLWGRASQSSVSEGKTAAAVYGSIEFAPSATLADAAFTLTPCVPDDTGEGATILDLGQTALLQYETLIAKAINDVINASSSITATFGSTTLTKTLAWKDYVEFASDGTIKAKEKDPSTYDPDASTNKDMSALGQILANTFVSFNTFKSSELRNGQGKIIAALMGDINTMMTSITNATITTIEEAAAQAVASHIKNVIGKYFNTSNQWNNLSTVINSSELGTESTNKITKDLNLFPDGIFHLPPGATVLKYIAVNDNGDNTFNVVNQYAYMSQVPTYAMGSVGGSFNPKNYMYPAELCYFGNSPIRVTSDTHVKADYPDGATNWDKESNWAAGINNNTVAWTKDAHVLSSTRSVAMQENINYGTSMLKTSIKYAEGVTDLKDNNSGLHSGEADNTIAVSGSPFTFTGLLIGGQPKTVGWNYITKVASGSTDDPYIYMVYDNDLPSTGIPTETGKENYTLVWDNYNASATNQNTVYVAVELTNNSGKDFWGENNLIRNGSSFYLIGKLDPDAMPNGYTIPEGEEGAGETTTQEQFASKKSWGITWPTKYALPPYDGSGNTIKVRRVFIQDFMTTANFVIGEESLKYALVSVPDLRASHLSLGLSVDLSWSTGLTFDDVILGQ